MNRAPASADRKLITSSLAPAAACASPLPVARYDASPHFPSGLILAPFTSDILIPARGERWDEETRGACNCANQMNCIGGGARPSDFARATTDKPGALGAGGLPRLNRRRKRGVL